MDNETKNNQAISKLEDIKPLEGPVDFFTGHVVIQPLFKETPEIPFSGAYVTFEPGARSAWHTHPCGQRLVVIEGIALTAEWNGKIHECHVGGVITCPSGVKHWHGATPDSKMTHMAFTGVKDGKAVEWMEKVTDEQYNGERA